MVADDPPRPTFRVELRVLGERVTVETEQPAGAIRLDEALPFLRALDDRVIEITARQSEAEGKPISCKKGCSACCRAQPVPVTPAEAHALLRLVEALPQPRQSEIRRRFADRVRRLGEAGLSDSYLRRDEALTQEQARAIARRYFQLGLVCPFLEDDACSIYADRPFVCRQYLVTSPAELCSDPFGNPVQPLPLPIAAAGAALQVAEQSLGRPQYTVPLVLALEYAAAHRQELERAFPARDVLERTVAALARPTDTSEETSR